MDLVLLFAEQVDSSCPLWLFHSLEAWCRSLMVYSRVNFECIAFCSAQTYTESGATFNPEIWPRNAIFTCTIHILCCLLCYFVR